MRPYLFIDIYENIKEKNLNKHLTKFRAPLVMLGGELNTTVLRSLQLIKDKLLLLMA